MWCGKIVRTRLLWPQNVPRSFISAPYRFSPTQIHGFSTKSDLFTLDFDLEEIDTKSSEASQKPSGSESKQQVSTSDENEVSSKGEIANIHGIPHPSVGETHNRQKDPVSESADREKLDDVLAGLMFDYSEAPENKDPSIDSLFGDIFDKKPSSTLSSNLLSDEELSDFDIDGSRHSKSTVKPNKKPADENVLADERELFEKIFATYSQADETTGSSDKLHQSVLSNLQDSFATVTKPAHAASPPRHAVENLSDTENRAIDENTRHALAATLKYIDELPTREAVVAFARDFFARFQLTEFPKTSFYLHKRRGESTGAYLARHEELSDETRRQSEATPESPVLNAFTTPVLFNHVISVLTNTHHAGALSLSLFNSAKEDLNLYTNVCNQLTYNEMLKVYWVFFGKRSLCEIELIVVEMMNNGFAGDKYTFSILKEILSTYYAMKKGQSNYNPGGQSIWSKEDEKRARNLSEKLEVLGKKLQREQFFAQGRPRISSNARNSGNSRRYK
ncbi:hypothetical protein JCM33374_g2711 [Metschnikowia sp. JCM 33374]|nr:hypothetical protein JCM33374_g2711 [Metschnikowia sp. JCM 33374]